MQNQNQSVVEKVELLRAAHAQGRLSEHEAVRAMCGEDSAAASSWGPAMRR